jgi:DNA-binding CsgD family transcriptional regulator
VFTDIGYLKKSNVISLSFLGMDGEPSFPNYKRSNDDPLLPNPLSKRELEVLRLLSKGLSSKEIALELSLSIHTVKNHRKNMLRKAEVSGSTGLLAKALENLWI